MRHLGRSFMVSFTEEFFLTFNDTIVDNRTQMTAPKDSSGWAVIVFGLVVIFQQDNSRLC